MPAATGMLDAAAPGGPPATERPSPSAPDTSVPRGARWLTLASVVVGLLNYAFTLGLTRLMSPVVFGHVAAAQSLILVCGTLATSSVPWVVASVLARQGNDERARGQVIGFSLLVNFGQALVAALVTATLAAPFLPPAALAALVGAVLAVFLATTPAGWLQGMRHFRALAALRVVEVIVKLGAGLALVALAPTATHALLGVFAGSAVIVVVGACLMRSDLALTSVSLRVGDLWRASLGNVGVQGLVAVLASTDVVLVALLDGGPGAGSYQAATVLARVPVFVAGAVATAVFPHLAAAGGGTGREHGRAQTMYLLLAVGYTIGLVTAPAVLVSSLFPQSYDQVGELLPWLAVSGLSVGLINLVTTYFQAATRYRQSMTVEVVAVVVHVGLLALGFHLGGILGVAIASPVAPTLAAAALLARAERWAPATLRAPRLLTLLCFAAGAAVGWLLRPHTWVWFALAVICGLMLLVVVNGQRDEDAAPEHRSSDGTVAGPSQRRLKILHLAFEDHRRPRSGGGSYRTHEISRRLARDHDVTVVTTTWPGAVDRVEDGVRYVHVGRAGGYLLEVVTYFLSLPAVVRRYEADIVIEDFAAPISSMAVPLFERRRPVLAMVQWLNARDKARQYHLPVHWVEALGLRVHSRYIAVSQDLAAEIRRRSPGAEVAVVPNGVDEAALRPASPRDGDDGARSEDVIFLGRLEIAQKGLDLLLEAIALVRDRLPGRVLLVGEGPDEDALRRRASELGLDDIVEFLGRAGAERFGLLRQARVLAMPSRFETFGIVAVEALASGTPVVAWDIPCLREVVPSEAGSLVHPFDVAAYAEELLAWVGDPQRCARAAAPARAFASRFTWDRLAQEQQDMIESVAAGPRLPPRRAGRRSPRHPRERVSVWRRR